MEGSELLTLDLRIDLIYVLPPQDVGPGIAGGAGVYIVGNVIANNTGAASDGISLVSAWLCRNNVIYGNGRHGMSCVQTYTLALGANRIVNNIIMNNGGYGIAQPVAQTHGDVPWIDYNAFYNNTSGARQNVNASPHDVTLTGDPFTNAAGNDFSLNNVAGAGAACRNAGFPGALPGLATPLGYADIGVYQHQDPAQGPVFRGATL